MSYIEQKFIDNTQKNLDTYKSLVAYWNLVKLQVPKILSCISMVFPHYTLHDVSHSEEILNSIMRILGKEAIDGLSTTDLWMILCAAYCHDIGMFISGDEIKKIFEEGEFVKYVRQIDKTSKLYEFAQCFKLEKNVLVYDNCILNLKSYNAARFLLADFLRKVHAKRAKDVMADNFTQIDWEIKRLYDLVLDECLMHGASFSEVMSKPRFEKGFGDDTCHPRFISCLLRLGDLLDFDSSRISQYLLKHLSDSIPGDSKNHVKKHASIKHIEISTERIEATAECEDCDTASEVDAWFSLIRDELACQRNQWYEIVPKNFSQSLPIFRDVEILLKNGYDKLDDKYQSSFLIDAKKTTELLQGSNIYMDKSKCFRELLQNAVDATFIRLYLECKDKISNDKEGYRIFVEQINQDEKYAINVSLELKDGGYLFSIKDHGVGMSKEDLSYLLKIGSSSQNINRKKVIDQMPEYAKPSGVFGIGFQSVFLLTDKVKLWTRQFDGGSLIEADLNSPLKNGFVALKTSAGDLKPYGTVIEFKINDTSLFKKNVKGYNSEFKTKFGKYDFIENTEDELFAALIQDEIAHFAYNSIVPIYFNKEKVSKRKEYSFYQDEDSKEFIEISPTTKEDFLYRNDYMDSSENMVVSFRFSLVENLHFANTIRYLPLNVNILSGNSLDILQINRDSFKEDYEIKLAEIIKRIGVKYLNEKFDSFENDELKMGASMFLEYYSENNLHKEWEKLPFPNEETFKSFIDAEKSLVVVNTEIPVMGNDMNQMELNDPKAALLTLVLRRKGYKIRFFGISDFFGKMTPAYEFSLKLKEDKVEWKSWLQIYKERKNIRSLMPCIGFDKLEVKENMLFRFGHDPMYIFEKISYPRTACPVVLDDEGNLKWHVTEKLIQWVYDNKKDKSITQKEIKNEYERMKIIFEPIIKELNG